jgi:cell division protein FtsN
MLQSEEREREILLGNGQLLGIFFVVAALLGVAFFAGYKMGQSSGTKKAAPIAEAALSASTESNASVTPRQAGETHSVSPEETVTQQDTGTASKGSSDLLGARKKHVAKADVAVAAAPAAPPSENFTPESGQQFLQVAAVPRDHALAVAAVLRKKGFAAHAVAKPGDASIYRVIVGPIHSPGDLSSTRDSLRKTGFSQIIVQHF